MPVELSRMISEVVAAAGEGAESLRRSGTEVRLRDCSIEVVLDDQPLPSARVVVSFSPQPEAPQPE